MWRIRDLPVCLSRVQPNAVASSTLWILKLIVIYILMIHTFSLNNWLSISEWVNGQESCTSPEFVICHWVYYFTIRASSTEVKLIHKMLKSLKSSTKILFLKILNYLWNNHDSDPGDLYSSSALEILMISLHFSAILKPQTRTITNCQVFKEHFRV